MTGRAQSNVVKVFLTCQPTVEVGTVTSREFVILIMALNTKTTSHLLCVPYREALVMSSNLMLISHSPKDNSVTVKIAERQDQKLFQAFTQKTFSSVSQHISKNLAFLIPVTEFFEIDRTCLSVTSLPLILNLPLPPHLQFLLTPPAQPPLECPACQLRVKVDCPADVTSFARHFYSHNSLQNSIIPFFLQTLLNTKQNPNTGQTVTTSPNCPLDFCGVTLPPAESVSRHVRRYHQFEVLMFSLMVNFKTFPASDLFSSLMKNCSNDSVKKFVVEFHKSVVEKKQPPEEAEVISKVDKVPSPAPVFDKTKATELMKRFFRQNVSDPGCKLFLKSKGEILKTAMYEKLLIFLFGSTSNTSECENILNFAMKNLKKIINEDDIEVERGKYKSSETFLTLRKIHRQIAEFQKNIKTSGLTSKTISKTFSSQTLKLVLNDLDVSEKIFFLKWRNSFYENSEPISVGDLESSEVLEETSVFVCSSSGTKFTNLAELLLHISKEQDTKSDGFKCSTCNLDIKELSGREERSADEMFDVLQIHLLSKAHLTNFHSEDKIPCTPSVCDVCNVQLGETDLSSHALTETHRNNTIIVMEYLQFCKSRNLDPVNHQEFQDFIFFLRYIHSMSINLQRPIRTTMEVISNIHLHFNKLLNVNESIDVTEEVIDKLSATEPAALFCFDCKESFLSPEEAQEHLSACRGLRCVVCRVLVTRAEDILPHQHHLQPPQPPLVTLTEAPDQEKEEDKMDTEPEEQRAEESDLPEPILEKVESEKMSVEEYSNTQEDLVGKAKVDITEIPTNTKSKTIVDHCVEKRKLEEDDLTSSPDLSSWRQYKRVKMDKSDISEENAEEVAIDDRTKGIVKVEKTEEVEDCRFESDLVTRVKMEPLEQEISSENYKLLSFDIVLTDIALTPEWRTKLQPQIIFLKKKAEVFNRWKNDINFYFNMSSK